MIELYYHAPSQIVQVWTYEFSTGWVQHGADIPVAFANGDTFGARATADGSVEVYKNGTLLGTRDITSWSYYASGGYIGLWLIHAPNARLDNFGGGNVGSLASAPVLAQDTGMFQLASYRPATSDLTTLNLPPLLPLSLPLQQTTSLTIDYTYDALNRLTGATYDDGRSFGYTYDAAGNVLELQQDLGSGTVTTTYTYNTANELVTAQVDGTVWQYTYDANGSLIEVLPNGNPGSGAKRYTYNVAGNLVKVEVHNGSNWDVQAEMSYNGLGQRLSMDAAGVIAYYVMNGDRPLTAESGGNNTFYLYGLGAIGEKTSAWSYSLPDGTNTPRQLTDAQGAITLSSRYTPWGDTLETYGTGNFSFGYLGGVLDATTGLIYVGNGQYYDPQTGRFLTRDARPNNTNPYVPWNPIGAILGPLGVIALVFGRKKKGSKVGTFLVLMLVTVSVGMTISACKVTVEVTPTEVPYPAQIVTVTTDTGYTATFVVPTPTSPSTPPTIPCLTPFENVPAPTQTQTPTPVPVAPAPSSACTVDCYDAYLTYNAVVSQLGRIPSIEEVLYMTAGTEYAAYSDNQAVANFGQEGLARTYYSVCYIKDGIPGCQGDELYQFLSGYEPWSDRTGVENNKKTPKERGEHLVNALNTNRDWLWEDVREINDFRVADARGWTDGRVPDKPWQWFGPFKPSDTCRKNVKPSLVVKYENGYEFWMLTSDETIKFNSFGCK